MALETGDDIFNRFSDQDCSEAWQEYGDDLLAEWIIAHPGTRPWAWWRFNAPAHRKVIGGDKTMIDNWSDWKAMFGEARYFTVDPDHRADRPVFEAERDYLARHKLLTAGE